jgi:hypothetical protein
MPSLVIHDMLPQVVIPGYPGVIDLLSCAAIGADGCPQTTRLAGEVYRLSKITSNPQDTSTTSGC